MHGCLRLVGCNVCHLAIDWGGQGRWSLSAVRAGYHRSSELVISCMAAYDWWDVMCAALLLAGVGGAGGPGEGAYLQSGQATTDHQNW
jgi:hypothetical protein